MFDKADLKAAVEAGALAPDQAAPVEGFLRTRSDPDKMLDPENLRFLPNFHDVLLGIGMLVLLAGVSFFSATMFGGVGWRGLTVTLMAAPVLIAAWALAEYFCVRRRLLLPSMVLAAAVCLSSGTIIASLLLPQGFEQA